MSDFKIVNRRRQHRFSSVSGEIPTIPGSGTTSTLYPDNTWATTDIMKSEIFVNTTDNRAWFRSDNGINELGYSGQTGTLLLLSDVPNSYAGEAGKFLQVNSSESGATFASFSGQNFYIGTASDFLATPSSGDTGKAITYDYTNVGYTLTDINQKMSGLTDCNSNLSAYTDTYMIKGNGTEYTLFNPLDTYVSLLDSQNIGGQKTFTAATIHNAGAELYQNLKFSGTLETVTIDNISTDTSFSGAADTELSTTLATKTYVDTQLWATGATSWVSLVGDDTITGTKTFSGPVIINSGITLDELTVSNNLIVSGNTYNKIDSYTYFGGDYNGSWRFYINPTGDLSFEKKISGVWTWKGSFA